MSRPVHIVAVSARTPVGLNAVSSAAALRAQVSRLGLHPFLVDMAGNKLRCAWDRPLASTPSGAPRIELMAAHALVEVLAELTRGGPLPAPLEVALALPEARPGFGAHEAHAVARTLASRPFAGVESVSVSLAGQGHAGALHALAVAARAVAAGRTELCIVGGADSYLEADTLDWLEAEQRVAREGVRGGFPPGEAACFLALASDGMRRQLRLPSLARVVGSAVAMETRDWRSDEGMLGEGLAQVVLSAGETLRPPVEHIHDVYCDINGERLRTDDWTLAILRAQRLFHDATAYTTCVGQIGDVGAASGALGCALAVQSWRRAYANGPRALVWGASWGGTRSACVLEHGEG